MKLLNQCLAIVSCGLLLIGCAKDQSLTPNPDFGKETPTNGSNGGGLNLNQDFYFQGDVGDTTMSLIGGVNNYMVDRFYSEGGGPNGSSEIEISSRLIESNDSNTDSSDYPAVLVSHVFHFPSRPFDAQPYRDSLVIGMQSFSQEMDSTFYNTQGVVVEYRDVNDVTWSSRDSLFTGSNSSFEVESYEIEEDTTLNLLDPIMTVKSKFNCTLYNENGDSIRIENGIFRGEYILTL